MLLAIDTATDRASIALGLPGSRFFEDTISGARRHAAGLLPVIQSLLRQAGASLRDISGIALSDGPGSFTGLRVGATVAKALVRARELPLWVAPSLLVRAAGVASDDSLILAIASALRGEIYAAGYRFHAGGIGTELAPSVQQPARLMSGPLRPSVVVGEAPAEILVELEDWVGRPVIGPPRGAPRAANLIDLVGKEGGAVRVEQVEEWEPFYGRPAEAQARWEMTHGRPLPDSVGSSR